MEKEVKDYFDDLSARLSPLNTTMIDSRVYIKHVDYLLSELRRSKNEAEKWELAYYREINRKRAME